MCGIVGYIGNKSTIAILLDGLLKLEYRGYDSAGISYLENNTLKTIKKEGRISNLQKELNPSTSALVGIGHTRWATHGSPSSINAHPHHDCHNQISVVHNGILENYLEIKEKLMEHGYTFSSETDTEIIPNLIHFYYQGNLLKAVIQATSELKGSYAIAVISPLEPDKIIAALKDSPLILGSNEDGSFIASDISAMHHAKEIYCLEEQEYAVLTQKEIHIYDSSLIEKKKKIIPFSTEKEATQKNGYADFMLKEIYEQPTVIQNTIQAFPSNIAIDFSRYQQIYIVACGTAMHAGLIGKYIFESQSPALPFHIDVEIASEFRYKNLPINSSTLVIAISQSGETADTLAAVRKAKAKGAEIIAITNVAYSTITRETKHVILLHAGPEIAVASTKAYLAQLVSLYLLKEFIQNSLTYPKTTDTKSSLLQVSHHLYTLLNTQAETIKKVAITLKNQSDLFFIGRLADYYTALEASLKLKEISYIHSEAYPSGELKHGPIALIENDSVVIAIITNPVLKEKNINNIKEVIARGAKVILITTEELAMDLEPIYECVLTIPNLPPLYTPLLSIVPLQLLAYEIAKAKDLDVDKPRNLAKSVTVE